MGQFDMVSDDLSSWSVGHDYVYMIIIILQSFFMYECVTVNTNPRWVTVSQMWCWCTLQTKLSQWSYTEQKEETETVHPVTRHINILRLQNDSIYICFYNIFMLFRIVNRIFGFGLWAKELLVGMCHYFLTV